ncbi:alpha/beta hydrolase [Lentibacter algarum]|uniref:alpha/beta fold hydrolase n=1 Tax=Lentibacter algarum TaxID=576131 RepID=UPI001C08914B|nr:alpha/beta hydrolase [Lentibacter algarum]MBU2983358.1 alpha/beta hydrolase [Lentibacter algarum]
MERRANTWVEGHGGVTLSMSDVGPLNAPEIILIHGWSQCSESFKRQERSFLTEKYRLIMPNLRGHGFSQAPDEAEAYSTSATWAADIAAVIEQLELHKPLLIGWSMGGWIVNDYIRAYGDDALAGSGLVGSSLTTGRYLSEAARKSRLDDPDVAALGMYEEDKNVQHAAVEAFLRACFATQPEPEDFNHMVWFNMMCKPHVRRACRMRNEDYRETAARMRRPCLVNWGAQERLVTRPMVEEAVATIPRATFYEYDDAGHAPFWEKPERFNADLDAFATQAFEEAA